MCNSQALLSRDGGLMVILGSGPAPASPCFLLNQESSESGASPAVFELYFQNQAFLQPQTPHL